MIKRTNTLFLTEYRNRILRFHASGSYGMAFNTWIVYRNGGGHSNIIKMTNATGYAKEYYNKQLKGTGYRYTKTKTK